MKTILRIYRKARPLHWYKYYLDINNKVVKTNSKEKVKMLLDLNGAKMNRFRGFGAWNNTHLYFICYYN